jgi:uncharacterized protein YecE (DUF72 family)
VSGELLYFEAGGTPEHLKKLQDALNAVADSPEWKHKIIVLPPSTVSLVSLRLEGEDSRLVCSCGWEWRLHDGRGMTGYGLGFLKELAKHTCLKAEDETQGDSDGV